MKAKFVQHMNSYKALGVGTRRPFLHGDKILFSSTGEEDIILTYDSRIAPLTGLTYFNDKTGNIKLPKKTILDMPTKKYSWTRINEFKQGENPYKALDIGYNRKEVKACKSLYNLAYDFAYNFCEDVLINLDTNIINLKEEIIERCEDEEWKSICNNKEATIKNGVSDAIDNYMEDKEVENYKDDQRMSTY